MKKIHKNLLSLLTFIGLFILSVTPTFAGFGVSPTNIYNVTLKPGSHFEKIITLSRSDTSEDLVITIEPDLGDIEEWVTYNPGLTFDFPAGESRKTFTVIVDIPSDAGYHEFSGVIRVRAIEKGAEVLGITIAQGARLDVNLETTEESVVDILVRSLKMHTTYSDEPMKLEIVAENLGNVEVSPTARITIMDLNNNELEKLETKDFGSIKPNETETLIAKFDSTVPAGEYFIEAEVLHAETVLRSERLVVTILEPLIPVSNTANDSKFTIGGFIRENGLVIFSGFIVIIIIYFMLTKLWERKDMNKKIKERIYLLLGSEVWSRIIISIIIGLGFSMLCYSLSRRPVDTNSEDTISGESEFTIEVMNNGSDSDVEIVDQDDNKEDVHGTSVIKDGGLQVGILRVKYNNSDESGEYPVYTLANEESEIIRFVDAGQEFVVRSQTDDWYEVEVDNGLYGWVKKSDIKSIKD